MDYFFSSKKMEELHIVLRMHLFYCFGCSRAKGTMDLSHGGTTYHTVVATAIEVTLLAAPHFLPLLSLQRDGKFEKKRTKKERNVMKE